MSAPPVVVLTPNPAVDVTYAVDAQEVGTTVRVRRVSRRPGGKGVNVAAVLRTLGEDVVALLPLSGDAGRWVRTALEAEGLPVAVVDVGGTGTRSTVTVVDDALPPTVYAEPGDPLPPAAWEDVLAEVRARCAPGGWFVVAGSFPPGDERVVGDLVRTARGAGARVVVDASGPALVLAADAGADLLVPNEEEARAATGAADLAGAVRRLRQHAGAVVVVSRGADGLEAHADGAPVLQPGVPGVVGNPTGAGDAATAGLVAALRGGADLPTAVGRAAVLGAAAVLAPLAGQVDPADVAALGARLPAPRPATVPPSPDPEVTP
ncbi:1-phosphofructokinase family hexose kinase [Pseudokineococcus lusitanus]|uniref:Tagatose 6-phosphate kinase n=1 Tax=Pseudokineococcus lusitanus TaxID=763993 RepID=A0A3N1G8P5_9ACTN|nr:PfkB family carbohydrate kinase [Pseudokineococcus lusitanus]ROP26615.1 tagatose 6-phosphate kinase [Pseudokineococcus lusitanus]